MIKEIPYAKKAKKLAGNNYGTAYKIMELALNQLRAYILEKPVKLNKNEADVIVNLGKKVGEVALGLEQRIIALTYAHHFDIKEKKEE